MPLRPCLGVGETVCNTIVEGRRCATCAAEVERSRTRGKRAVRPYTAAERDRRAAAVEAHVAEHGWSCPGWGVVPHASRDLTADHVAAVGAGGREDGPLGVLCRPCNGRKGVR